MIRRMIVITGVWLMTLGAILLLMIGNQQEPEKAYKISINRILDQLSSDWNQNRAIIKNLSDEELSVIETIDLIDVNLDLDDQIKNFFFE